MNFSGISYNSFYGRLLRFALKIIPAEMQIPILQGKLRGKKWIVGSFNHGCWLGSYEYHKRVIFESLVKEGSVVYDIGAHVGFYTLLASVCVGATGRVFAFEPVPRNLYYLKKHIQLNNICNVTLSDTAVLDYVGWTFFDEGPGKSMAHVSSTGKLKVRTVTLDYLIENGEAPIPNFIKIDIEGSEMSAFLGARSLLSNMHPTIFLATHGLDIHKRCCNFLKDIGYRLSTIDQSNDLENTDEIIAYYK